MSEEAYNIRLDMETAPQKFSVLSQYVRRSSVFSITGFVSQMVNTVCSLPHVLVLE